MYLSKEYAIIYIGGMYLRLNLDTGGTTLLSLGFGRYLERRNKILPQLNDDQRREKDPKSNRYGQRSPMFIKNE